MPSAAALSWYSALIDTTYTAPASSIANEFSVSSPRSRLRIEPVAGSIVTSVPLKLSTQMRPVQSGSAEVIRSLEESMPETS